MSEHKHVWETVGHSDLVSCVECGWLADITNPRPNPEGEYETLREIGCTECSGKLDGLPFVHHETSGSFGGPWCIPCAVKYGFGTAEYNNQDNFYFHPYDEE